MINLSQKETEMLWSYLQGRPWIEVNDLCVMIISKIKESKDDPKGEKSD